MANKARGPGETWDNYRERLKVERKIERLERRGQLVDIKALPSRDQRRGHRKLTPEQQAFMDKKNKEAEKSKA